MQVRLGFAVATALEVDVLLLDEVLAVGDASFRHRCYNRIDRLRESAAVIFVSHAMDQVAHVCSQVLMMSHGKAQLFQSAMEGISAYNSDASDNNKSSTPLPGLQATYTPVKAASMRISSAKIKSGSGLHVTIEVDLEKALIGPDASFVIRNEAEQNVYCWNSSQFDEQIHLPQGRSEFRFLVDPIPLMQGSYRCCFLLCPPRSLNHCVWLWNACDLIVTSDRAPLDVIAVAPYRGHSVKRLGG
jgi:lipopolysaccharide transport system ATP-binding protein